MNPHYVYSSVELSLIERLTMDHVMEVLGENRHYFRVFLANGKEAGEAFFLALPGPSQRKLKGTKYDPHGATFDDPTRLYAAAGLLLGLY